MLLRIWDVSLTVSDLQRAAVFYEQVLGLSKKYKYSSYAGFDCGGVEIGLVPGEPAEHIPGVPVVDFLVEDIDEAYQALSTKGVQFLKPPQDTQWGSRLAVFTDPDGNRLQLVQIEWRRYFEVSSSA